MSQDSVFACVASLCSAYHEGSELIQKIKANSYSCKNRQETPLGTFAQELELSLKRGESAVRSQYERIHERCGKAFARGDHLARDALQNSITHLKEEVIAHLRRQWEQDTLVDFISLQDTCDSIQNRAILVLMQLQQRTITWDPVDALPYGPLNTIGPLSSPPPKSALFSKQNISPVVVSSSHAPASSNPLHIQRLASLPSVRPTTPPSRPYIAQCSPPPDSARWSKESTRNNRRDAGQYKPMATTVTTTGFLGIGKRTKVEPTVNPPENPLVDEYLAVAMEDAKFRMHSNASIRSRSNSKSTSKSSVWEPNQSAFNPWQKHQSSSPDRSQGSLGSIVFSDTVGQAPFHKFASALRSYDSQRRGSTVEILSSNRSISSIDPKILLPSEYNEYAGFCKGAWRQQIGDMKRAMEERLRPGGMFNAAKYYQCKQCKFEGRLIPMDKNKSGFDMRVFKLVQGIQFRWEFMFKSHVHVKETCSDPTRATFGCIFCCAEGRGTPTFRGIQTFMNHLLVHREHLPIGEVLYRMNCLVGKQAAITEHFDINIISIEAGKV